ncbi:MAG: RHS repeat-associated core domain-containing protein [Anaerolineae bacterium]
MDYTWDANGNLLSDGVRTFTYDAANRLTSVTSGTLTTTFEYDGLGNRVAQTVDGVTTEYVLDVAGGLPEVIVATTGGASTRYVQVQGQILAQYESGAWVYILPDHLGSVRQVLNSAGQVDLAQSYDPFGVLLEAAGSGASEFGYAGEQHEADTGLVFLRARYYDPASSRFISNDVFPGHPTSPQSLNGWSYAGNNPVRYTDPSGLIYIEGWGYTCDDPAVENGIGPDGKPCIPAPPGATLETLNLCSPLRPGDESWKSRPQCNYAPPLAPARTSSATGAPMTGVAPSLSGNQCDPPYDGYVEGFSISYGGALSGLEEIILGRRHINEIFFVYTVEFEWVYDFIHKERGVFLAASQTFETSLGVNATAAQYQGTIDGFSNYPSIRGYEGAVWNSGFSVGASFLNAYELGYTQWQAGPANQYATGLGDLSTTEVDFDSMKINYTGYFASFGYSVDPPGALLNPLFPKGLGPSGVLVGGPGVARQMRGPFPASSEQMADMIESGHDPELGIRPIIGGPLFNPKRRQAAEVLRNYAW